MKIAFDLDGTLDRKPIQELARTLLDAGHEVHIVSGVFSEAGEWQSEGAKLDKLIRMGLIRQVMEQEAMRALNFTIYACSFGKEMKYYAHPSNLHINILMAMPAEKFDRAYRLADLGLRKGAYLERHGIDLMIDDSETYIEMMPKMCGATMLHVR